MELDFGKKFWSLPIFMIFIMMSVGIFGVVILYSAGGGNLHQWALPHFYRIIIGLMFALVIGFISPRYIMKYSLWGYFFVLGLLVWVEFYGVSASGAKRWIDILGVRIQPSEFMKIILVVVIARYYNNATYFEVRQGWHNIIPLVYIALPVILVLNQPDLGTAIILAFCGLSILFYGGVQLWKFLLSFFVGIIITPFIWQNLHSYQQNRILNFLDPQRDPLATGYHIIQSKIAFGSGGLFGYGFMQGPQSQLSFLPEKHTDFVFALIGEELGLVGTTTLLLFYIILIYLMYRQAMRSRSLFHKLVCLGVAAIFFIYIFVNMAMVMGFAPIVGIPLPLISYGGSAVITLFVGLGLVINAAVYSKDNLDNYRTYDAFD